MTNAEKIEFLIRDLPDPSSAQRFFAELSRAHPRVAERALENDAVLSDVLTLASYSPLLAGAMMQDAGHVAWLGRERLDIKIRSKEQLLESLARFALAG